MTQIVVMRDRYDNQVCLICGHNPTVHNLITCYMNLATGKHVECDCTGWIANPNWPPPMIIGGDA